MIIFVLILSLFLNSECFVISNFKISILKTKQYNSRIFSTQDYAILFDCDGVIVETEVSNLNVRFYQI